MKQVNKYSMSFPSYSSNEFFARAAISAFLLQLDPTVEELNDMKTAVSEAVTNCIVHAYKDYIGTVYLNAWIFENNVVKIKIRDKGCGIGDIKLAVQPLYTTAGGERAGLGFAVMESFTDKMQVTSKPGKGTTVTLTKKFSVRVKQNG